MATANETVTLSNGDKLPLIGLGTHALAEGEQTTTAVKAALRHGYKHLDCASIYQNEASVGAALAELVGAGELTRGDVFVTSKLWNTHHPPALVAPALDKQLANLRLEYVDLYLMHWPLAYKDGDNLKPFENGKMVFSDVDYLDTWKAMEELVRAGKAKAIGLSNFNSAQISRILQHCTVRPVALQVEMNCHNTNSKLLDFARKNDIRVIAYAPLSTPSKQREHKQLLAEDAVVAVAQRHGKTPAQVALRWLVQQGVATVPKSANPGRIQQNSQVFDFELTDDEIKSLAALNRGYRVYDEKIALDHKYYPFHDEF